MSAEEIGRYKQSMWDAGDEVAVKYQGSLHSALHVTGCSPSRKPRSRVIERHEWVGMCSTPVCLHDPDVQ